MSLGIWILSVDQLKAEQPVENYQLSSQLTKPVVSVSNLRNTILNHHELVANQQTILLQQNELEDNYLKSLTRETSIDDLEKLNLDAQGRNNIDDISNKYQLKSNYFLIAAPENFNPSLRNIPPKAPEKLNPPEKSLDENKPFAVLESIDTNFVRDANSFNRVNQFIEPTAQFRLENGNKIRFKTGVNSFSQSGIDAITNIPVYLGWESDLGDVKIQTGMGVDLFDRLPTAINLNANIAATLSPAKVSSTGELESLVVFSSGLEYSPYKFNAKTLDNQIKALRFSPSIFWKIDRHTQLYSTYKFGDYNDGNFEQQSFSRLERKIGSFSVAANLFTWSYAQDLESKSGYFSPPDFLVYTAEIAWEGDIINLLRCRFAATFGQQRLKGKFDNANNYETRCTVKISPNLEADLGYTFSNVKNGEQGADAYNNNSLAGQLRMKF